MTATPVIGTTFFGLDISGLGDGLKTIRRRISRSTLLIELGPRMLQIAEARQRSHGIEIRHFSRIDRHALGHGGTSVLYRVRCGNTLAI